MNKFAVACLFTGLAALAPLAASRAAGTYVIPDSCQGVYFVRNLRAGDTGKDVACLQMTLNEQPETQVAAAGAGSPGHESDYYGRLTAGAVAKFQERYAGSILAPLGLSRGTGFFGASTRAELLTLLTQSTVPAPTPTPSLSPLPAASVNGAGPQTVYPSTATQAQTDQTEAVIAKDSPSVVSITITKQVPEYQVSFGPLGVPVYQPTGQTQTQEIGAGTGFIITADGYILTNKHVVFDSQATYTVTQSSGQKETASVVYKDSAQDVAILKIRSENYPALQLGNSDALQAGQPVIAIGNALGQYSNSVSVGIISGLHRQITAYDSSGVPETLNDVIQTDAGINPGNSGGPLLDLQGTVVGINVAEVQGSNNISFALPINPVKEIVQKILPTSISKSN